MASDPIEPEAASDAGGRGTGADADPAEIDRLFREHNAALLRFVATKLGSEQEAREVAQEAYVKLLSLDRPGAISHLRGYLFKTAANLAVDRLRQRARRGTSQLESEMDLRVFEISPEREVSSAQSMQILRAALDELPGNCRQVFTLHRVHELSCAEIASRMDMSERTVRHYVGRAIQHLRTRLDQAENRHSQEVQS